ncbi:MAG: glycerol-3-phosphate acyltransferase [Acidobacteriia bacterium]|nr:glycerol-3-phosphate acyltransferase [Terriglobia bacterium]
MPDLGLEFSAALVFRFLGCFLIGSVPFAVLAMQGTGIDIRKAGSGNPGFNNVLSYNKWRAVVTLLGDLGKGLAAIWIFLQPGQAMTVGWLFGLAAILGHCYSPFLKFNGGKGIATSAGVMLYLYPVLAMASLAVFSVLRVTGGKRRWIEAGTIASLATYALFVVLLLVWEGTEMALFGTLLLVFVAWRHRSNFRILFGSGQAQ